MNGTLLANGLLAQYSRWKRLGDGLHRSHGRMEFSDLLPYLIVLAVLGIGIAVVVAIMKYNDLSKPCDDPQKLFRELSWAHGLDRGSQRLLRQLATAAGLGQPAEIFLTPSAFEANQLPAQLQVEQQRVLELRKRLF